MPRLQRRPNGPPKSGLRALLLVAALAGPCLAAPQPERGAGVGLIDRALRGTTSSPAVASLVEAVCGGQGRGVAIEALCAAPPATDLRALRHRLLVALAGSLADAAGPLDRRLAAGLLASLMRGPTRAEVAALVARAAAAAKGARADGVWTAARLLERWRPGEVSLAWAEEVLGVVAASLEPRRRVALEQLDARLRAAEALLTRPVSDEADLLALATALAGAVEAALAAAGLPNPPSLGPAVEAARALVVADLRAGVIAALALLDPSVAEGALGRAARLLTAADPVAALRAELLGPWAEPLIFDFAANVPYLDVGNLDFAFDGHLLLGYQWARWGLSGRAAVHAYDLVTDAQVADTTQPEGELHLWGSTAPGGPWAFEGRLELGASLYDTTVIPVGGADGRVFAEETSTTFRGALLLGVRHVAPRRALALWLGAGGQLEDYSGLSVDARARVRDETRESSGLLLRGRLRAQQDLLGDILSLRLAVDLVRHDLQRAAVSVSFDTREVDAVEQIELRARLALDWRAAALFGFVPGLDVGLDWVRVDDAGGSTQTLVPLAGVGLRRVSF